MPSPNRDNMAPGAGKLYDTADAVFDLTELLKSISTALGGNGISTAIPALTPVNGELAGATSATQMPSVAAKMVKFKAEYDNAGRVYIGASGVTKADGSTDITTGLQLSPGEETPWLLVSNINVFYRICDNAGDDLTYIVMR